MKKYVFTAAAILLAAACTHENPESPVNVNEENLVRFTIESAACPAMGDNGSKTSLSADLEFPEVYWSEGDNVILFDNSGSCTGHQFTGTVQSDPTLINLEGAMDDGSTKYWLLYPYNSGSSFDGTKITTTLSATQTAVAGTFANNTAISLASGTRTPGETSASKQLEFSNLCSLLSFNIPSYVNNATSVTIASANGAAMAGTIIFRANSGTMEIVSGSSSVTLSGSFTAGARYFAVVAPNNYEGGFVLTLTTEGGASYSASYLKDIDADPACIYHLGTLGLKLDVTPTVTISHSYVHNNTTGLEDLTGSNAELTIPSIADELSAMIDHWDISLVKDNTVYRTATSNGMMTVTNGLSYLPEGTYNISATYYTLDGRHKTIIGTATAPAPALSVSATITHTTNDAGQLNGSRAVLTIPVASELSSQISWEVRMRNGSTLCRTATQANGEMDPSGIYTYLPKGNYSIEATYRGTDNVSHVITNAAPIISEAPTFSVTTGGYTSYDCYVGSNGRTKSTSDANNCNGSTIHAVSVTVGITPELLSNFSHSQSYQLDNGSVNSFDFPAESNTYNCGDQGNQSWGSHTLKASVTFDGVEVKATDRPFQVTGLPYNATPPSNSGSNTWSAMEGKITWNTNYVDLFYSAAKYPRIKSPSFNIPDDTNVTVSAKIVRNNYSALGIKPSGNLVISLSDDKHKYYNQNLANNSTYESSFSAEMTSSLNVWRIQYEYAATGPHTYVYYFRINYRNK